MFKNVLVPSDLTEKSKKALKIAVEMAMSKDPHRITLLHVIETIEDADSEEFDDFYEKLKLRAEREMLEMTQAFQQGNIEITTRIEFGTGSGKLSGLLMIMMWILLF